MFQSVKVQNMISAANRKLRHQNIDRRNKSIGVQRLLQDTHSTLEIIGERFAAAILSGDRSETDRILHEIAKISPPPVSPEKFIGLMSRLLARAAHCAVKQHMVQEKFRNLALTDDLTGLLNRRGFFALAGQQLKFARRNHQYALLFFADVDGLKQINDRFGHSEGDLAIKRVTQILKHTFRDSDIVARLGGDEFAVLANEASSDCQKDIWRRLKEDLNSEGSHDPRYSLSLSIGVARYNPRSLITLEELLNYADQAMYKAKRVPRDIHNPATLFEAPCEKYGERGSGLSVVVANQRQGSRQIVN